MGMYDIFYKKFNNIYMKIFISESTIRKWDPKFLVENKYENIDFSDILNNNGTAIKLTENNNTFTVNDIKGKKSINYYNINFSVNTNIDKENFYRFLSKSKINNYDFNVKDNVSCAYSKKENYYLLVFLPNDIISSFILKEKNTYYNISIKYFLLFFNLSNITLIPLIVIFILFFNRRTLKNLNRLVKEIDIVIKSEYKSLITLNNDEFNFLIKNLNKLILTVQKTIKKRKYEIKYTDSIIYSTSKDLNIQINEIKDIYYKISKEDCKIELFENLKYKSTIINRNIRSIFYYFYYRNHKFALSKSNNEISSLVIEILAEFIPKYEQCKKELEYNIHDDLFIKSIDKYLFVDSIKSIFSILLEKTEEDSKVYFKSIKFNKSKLKLVFDFDIDFKNLNDFNNCIEFKFIEVIIKKHDFIFIFDEFKTSIIIII
jgi:hypothetical protein